MYSPTSENFANEASTQKSSVIKVVLGAGVCALCFASGFVLGKSYENNTVEPMFVPTMSRGVPTSLFADMIPEGGEASMPTMEASSEGAVPAAAVPEPVAYTPAAPSASMALPWTSAPAHLTGELPGDDGFDPFGFAADGNLNKMREAEIKHSRLAMLAAAGWPISERLDPVLAKILNLPVVLNEDGTAPSILNGGLDKVSIFYWGAVLGAAAVIELRGNSLTPEDRAAGNFDFDPLGFLNGKSPQEVASMQRKELKNGRLAMTAIVMFALQEALVGKGVYQTTPGVFEPFWDTFAAMSK